MTKRNITVVMPAYNEERSVSSVVRKVLSIRSVRQCIVVNDGSNDDTERQAKKAGAFVINMSQNMGASKAVLAGLLYAKKNKADFVVLMDADGQHNPDQIPQLIETLNNNIDYVIGSRYIVPSDHSTSFTRRLGTRIISHLIYISYGKRIYDPTSGYRALNSKMVSYLSNNYPLIFPEPEILLDILGKKFRIAETPSQMEVRKYGNSSISFIKALYLILYIMLRISYRKLIG